MPTKVHDLLFSDSPQQLYPFWVELLRGKELIVRLNIHEVCKQADCKISRQLFFDDLFILGGLVVVVSGVKL